MYIRNQRFVLLILATLIPACRTSQSEGPSPDQGGVQMRDGATILTGDALADGRGSLLSTMRGKVPNLRIQLYQGQCPKVSIRSHVTFQSVVEPHIYVDGTRATNTCILESLQAQDVASVEVYPMGFIKRPGYGTHAHGLILIFMRSG